MAGNTQKNSGKNTGRGSRQTTTKPAVRNSKKNNKEIINNRIKDEVILFVMLGICILLIISNFGIGGAVSDVVSGFLFGIMGVPAYIFPLVLMAVVYMLIVFKYDEARGGYPAYKVVCIALFMVFLSMFFELLANKPEINILDSYLDSYHDHSYGGFVGGCLALLFGSAFGRAGAFVVDILGAIICVIIYTGRSLMNVLRRVGKNVADVSAEKGSEFIENTKERLEEKREERRQMRMERKAESGVSFDTLIKAEEDISTDDMREIHENDGSPRLSKDMHELSFASVTQLEAEGETEPEPDEMGEVKVYDSHEYAELEPVPEGTVHRSIEPVENVTAYSQNVFEQELTPVEEIVEPEQLQPEQSDAELTEQGQMYDEAITLVTPIDPVTSMMPATEERTELNKETAPKKPAPAVKKEPSRYVFPPIDLLKKPTAKAKGDSEAHLAETSMKLAQTLKYFGVNVNVTEVTCGPTVTRYEIQPEPGTKVSKIINLTDDIKLNLAAADIRMEAPIPGKAAIGIEVPNKEAVPVFFRELVESNDFKNHESRISFAAGKDIAGSVVMADIAKMPHLLIAGSTGSGKSVCINTIIMSILYHARPDEVKLIMIDPKVVELSVYNGIPHLLIPVVTDPKKAAGALNWAVSEMMDRYDKFASSNVRDMKGYNELAKNDDTKSVLPQIVVIVDELADLMMVASNDVEDAICRLAQLARAAGIHLIIATQRPSVNVITGLIKANMPSRIAFAVTSGVDSRTILDMVGAEKLLGKGDMLYYPQGLPKPVRLQGAFVSDGEVGKVVSFIKEQCGETTYSSEIEKKVEELGNSGGTAKISQAASAEVNSGSDYDELLRDAGNLVIDQQKASIGLLQRKFKIGFNRAARIMDQLEELGVVSSDSGTKAREVLMDADTFSAAVENIV